MRVIFYKEHALTVTPMESSEGDGHRNLFVIEMMGMAQRECSSLRATYFFSKGGNIRDVFNG